MDPAVVRERANEGISRPAALSERQPAPRGIELESERVNEHPPLGYPEGNRTGTRDDSGVIAQSVCRWQYIALSMLIIIVIASMFIMRVSRSCLLS
ncbi:MAG TPA: hypothetical protein VOB72_23205 [Candidatus Dormibacteraeota bacterium]|nr:hypothetical protein [Candidatus Dormibacteraeota bacterium]